MQKSFFARLLLLPLLQARPIPLLRRTTSGESLLPVALTKTYAGLKSRNLDPYLVKCFHRPYSEIPDDCVSEGIGYFMILALYSNDQAAFNEVYVTAENKMWNGNGYNWRISVDGETIGFGPSTSADEDIAFALLSAQHLVDQHKWQANTNPTYGNRAQSILDSLWNNTITSKYNLAPGQKWGGDSFVNPGYLAMPWYRMFSAFDANKTHNWTALIDRSYETLHNSPGYKFGLVPDWMTPEGHYYYSGLGYNTYLDGKAFYKDAIRTLWHVGTDLLWYNDSRAHNYLDNAYNFITSKGGPKACNFYQMNGDLVPKKDIWVFDAGQRTRTRQEHSPLTIGMWSIVPYALGKPDWTAYRDEFLSFYKPNETYFGLTTGNETIDHNEMYYDQFLGWFGAIIMNGTWNKL